MHEGPAYFFDGLLSRRRAVTVRLRDTLEILENARPLAVWDYPWVRRVDAPPGELRLRSANGSELARLVIADPVFAQAVAARCPRLDAEDALARSGRWRIVGWSLAAAASLVALAVWGVPLAADRLALLAPLSVEERLGEAVDRQVQAVFSTKGCANPAGVAAFDKMIGALQASGDLRQTLRASVIASAVPKAVALPGGKVYLFRGLLERAQNPDEIAGVLAHEIGHVKNRDGLRKLIQVGGTSFLFGLLFGDVAGSGAAIFAARSLLDASYSREAETRADDHALATLAALGRPARPMGELLVRITGRQRGGLGDLFSSHPFSEDRLARLAASAPATPGRPILTDDEWRALKAICASAT